MLAPRASREDEAICPGSISNRAAAGASLSIISLSIILAAIIPAPLIPKKF
jgi:hypothetical protein